jgi:hypothetical protein
MADTKGGMSGTQITVALIGAGAVVASALIANAGKIAPAPAPTVSPAPAPSPSAGASADPQPIVPEPAPPPAPAVANLGGAWRSDDGTVMTFAQDGDRFSSEQADGDERVTIEGQISGRSVKLWVDYFQSSSGGLGLRIMNCDGRIDEDAQRVRYSCLNPQTNVTTRPTWTRV